MERKKPKPLSKLEQLYDITCREGIYCEHTDLHAACPDLHGCYIHDPTGGPVILLDKSLEYNTPLHACVLSEEVGHYFTAPRTDLTRVYHEHREANMMTKLAQDERKALRWATDFLIPDVELCRALTNGYRKSYELAEYFVVTEWFIKQKLELFRLQLLRMGRRINFTVEKP